MEVIGSRRTAARLLLLGAACLPVAAIALPIGRVTLVNQTEGALLDVRFGCACRTEQHPELAAGASATMWFWGCGESTGFASYADRAGSYDRIEGGYLDPSPSGGVTITIGEEFAQARTETLISIGLVE